ncbi:MAG: MYXO-CTERM sorting domain-containing protein, partial [Myxococcota bacterium]
NEDSYKVQVSQGEIERFRPVTYTLPGTNWMLVLGTEGDNQPPRYGISATVVDMDTLEPVSSELIAAAYTRNNQEVLSTMPHAARLGTTDEGTTRFLVSYQTRVGRRRKGDKGATILNVGLLEATAEGEISWAIPPAEGVFPGLSATHHTMCETRFGNINEEVEPAAVLLTTSFQGGSSARATIITYDEVNNVIEHRMTVAMNVRHDNALVSNMYGNNPNQEGKNSQYCISVDNPGFGVADSFAPDVQQFMLFPAAERRVGRFETVSEKLALSVAMVPTVFNGPDTPISTPIDPTDPEDPTDPVEPTDPVDPVDPTDPVEPGSGSGGGDGAGNGGGGGNGTVAEQPQLEVEPSTIESSGGCAATPASAPLLLLSLAALLRRRRRRN